jgi:ATP-dependent Lon protease
VRATIAVFPLPNIILFPGAFLPLHIFESRYRLMLDYCIESDYEMAITSLHGNSRIENTFGWGKIVRHEPLSDGRANILLEGMGIANLINFKSTEPFIIAEVEKIENDYSHIKTEEFKDLTNELIHLTKEYLRKLKVEDVFINEIDKLITHPFPVEFIASVINCDFKKKQEILITENPYQKAIKLLKILNDIGR